MDRDREQKLINLCFELVLAATDPRSTLPDQSIEDRMEWVARQLRGCGFDTEPVGVSWGVLKINTAMVSKDNKKV